MPFRPPLSPSVSPRPSLGGLRGGFLAGLLALGCGGSERPRWVDLVQSAPVLESAELGEGWSRIPQGVQLDLRIAAEDWRPTERGEWRVRLPSALSDGELRADRLRLAFDGRGPVPLADERLEFPPGSFRIEERTWLRWNPPPGSPKPGAAVLTRCFPGTSDGRVELGPYCGDGFLLLPGERLAWELDLGPGTTLRGFAAVDRLGFGGGAPVRLRGSLDGEPFFEREFAGDGARGAWFEAPLPPAGHRTARLVLEVAGGPAAVAVIAPRLGPSQLPGPDARRWGDPRPHLVLFLADTFRADNLSPWGGSPELAPGLESLIPEGLCFERAWASATWTLPSQSTMLTGMQPPQHGAVARGLGLAGELETLTERLHRAGYRTGAVTDSEFVSRRFGFDQGFEWFHETHDWSLRHTLELADAFLAADDGRPVFLFVHTYRTHSPYRVGIEEDEGPMRELLREMKQRLRRTGGDGSWDEAEAMVRWHELYREGVSGLDRLVAPWFRDLRRQGWLENGVLLFTSDHGEAFGEHGQVGHVGEPWEPLVRIPLFLWGGRVAPGRVSEVASLVDVPRTLCALAGVPPARDWGGRVLVEPSDPLVFAFRRARPGFRVALRRGDRKVVAPADPEGLAQGRILAAFELDRDPDENTPIQEPLPWIREFCLEAAPALRRFLDEVHPAARVELSPAELQRLAELGYAGD